jgi:hypothetical protein
VVLRLRSDILRSPSQTVPRRLMSTESVSVGVSSVALGVMPRAPRSAVGVAGSILHTSCIVPALLPLRVSPYEHHNRWQCLASVSQGREWKDDVSDGSEAGLECSVDLLSVSTASDESLARLDVEEVVPPVREVRPPDPVRQSLRPLSGALATTVNKKSKSRRRGGKKVDGESTGTVDFVVAAYTALFLHDMGAPTAHSVQSSDLHVIISMSVDLGCGVLFLFERVSSFPVSSFQLSSFQLSSSLCCTVVSSRVLYRAERTGH